MASPASPTFAGTPIFDSIRADDSTFSEGCLWVPEYTKIYQTIHFNGEDGDRLISHGFPNRQWVFEGIMSADTVARLKIRLSAIQDQIDAEDYHILVDSWGNTYTNAKVMHMHLGKWHVASAGYVVPLRVEGIIQSMAHDGN